MADDPNLYSYGFNSPLNYIDPSGMVGESLFKFSGMKFDASGGLMGVIGSISPEAGMVLSFSGSFVGSSSSKKKVDKAETAKKDAQDKTMPIVTHQQGGYSTYTKTKEAKKLEGKESELRSFAKKMFSKDKYNEEDYIDLEEKVTEYNDLKYKFNADSESAQEIVLDTVGSLKKNNGKFILEIESMSNGELVDGHAWLNIRDSKGQLIFSWGFYPEKDSEGFLPGQDHKGFVFGKKWPGKLQDDSGNIGEENGRRRMVINREKLSTVISISKAYDPHFFGSRGKAKSWWRDDQCAIFAVKVWNTVADYSNKIPLDLPQLPLPLKEYFQFLEGFDKK